MKHSKILMFLIACCILSSSADAVVIRTEHEKEEVCVRLGTAIYAALNLGSEDHPLLRLEREDYEEFKRLAEPYQDWQQLARLSDDEQKESLAAIRKIKLRMGLRHFEDPTPLLEVLESLSNTRPINEIWGLYYHRANLLLSGIGVGQEEEEQRAAKRTAFTLIERVLEHDSQNDLVLELLFQYFLPDNPLALTHLRRLEEAVATKDGEQRRYDPMFEANRHLRSDVKLLATAYKILDLP